MTSRLAFALAALTAGQAAYATTCDPSSRPATNDKACECYDRAAEAVVVSKNAGNPNPVRDADLSTWVDGFTTTAGTRTVALASLSETVSDSDNALYGGSCLDADGNFAGTTSTTRKRKLAQYGSYARAAAEDVSNSSTSGFWLDYGLTITGGGTYLAQVDDQFGSWGTTTTFSLAPPDLSAGNLLLVGPPSMWEMQDEQGTPIGMLDASGSSSAAEGIVVHINPETGARSIDVVTADGRAHTFFDVGHGYVFLSL